MGNLIIKGKGGAGNKLILQDQAGGAVLTTADSGATFSGGNIGTVTAGTLGSGVTFPAGAVVKHQKVLTAISSQQVGTTTYANITGSSITYTPATGADYIVYECSFVSSSNDANPNPLFAFRFFIDGAITKNQDSYAPYGAWNNANQWSSIRETHKMVYSASGWTTGKAVKMQFRVYGGTNLGNLHVHHYDYLTADGSTMASTNRLTDVITTIYSVMA